MKRRSYPVDPDRLVQVILDWPDLTAWYRKHSGKLGLVLRKVVKPCLMKKLMELLTTTIISATILTGNPLAPGGWFNPYTITRQPGGNFTIQSKGVYDPKPLQPGHILNPIQVDRYGDEWIIRPEFPNLNTDEKE